MSKKKSFNVEALNTITGGDPSTKEVSAKKSNYNTKKASPTPKSRVQPVVSRNTSRTGKAVTLYLNTANYSLFKKKAKEEGKSASTVINEMIVKYLS